MLRFPTFTTAILEQFQVAFSDSAGQPARARAASPCAWACSPPSCSLRGTQAARPARPRGRRGAPCPARLGRWTPRRCSAWRAADRAGPRRAARQPRPVARSGRPRAPSTRPTSLARCGARCGCAWPRAGHRRGGVPRRVAHRPAPHLAVGARRAGHLRRVVAARRRHRPGAGHPVGPLRAARSTRPASSSSRHTRSCSSPARW